MIHRNVEVKEREREKDGRLMNEKLKSSLKDSQGSSINLCMWDYK